MVGRRRYRPIQTMSRDTDLPLLSNLNRNRSHGFTNLNNVCHPGPDNRSMMVGISHMSTLTV